MPKPWEELSPAQRDKFTALVNFTLRKYEEILMQPIETTAAAENTAAPSAEHPAEAMPPIGPTVTKESIEAIIESEQYSVPPHTTLTICVMRLKNGFMLVGHSACAAPENFDAGIGRKLARQDCVRQIWPLEGYLLREKLSQA